MVSFAGLNKHNKALWKCRCACGCVREIVSGNLLSGITTSCGCRRSGVSADERRPRIFHGMSGTGVQEVWRGIIKRCCNPQAPSYKYYGGRGIKICERISSNPKAIVELIGPRPKFKRQRHFSIDRIENKGHYSCGSCQECKKNRWPMNIRWTTQRHQNRNKRNNRMITINRKTLCMADWSLKTGVVVQTISSRLRRGYSGVALISKRNLPNR